jgi:hypothetical protein
LPGIGTQSAREPPNQASVAATAPTKRAIECTALGSGLNRGGFQKDIFCVGVTLGTGLVQQTVQIVASTI